MTPEQILAAAPLVLPERERERYFEDGFLAVPGYVGVAWLARLRAVVTAKIEESRALAASDDQFDLAPDHTAEKPDIRRLRKAVDQHPELWEFAKDPAAVDLCADLLGPDIRFHSSKLNFKWSEGGDAVRWLRLPLQLSRSHQLPPRTASSSARSSSRRAPGQSGP